VLEIDEGNAVTIKQIENAIVNRAWDEGWIVPQPPRARPATVAVIGSGPGGHGVRAAAEPRRPHA
jgi:glutamate synthase (NADPH/NADH) small chain